MSSGDTRTKQTLNQQVAGEIRAEMARQQMRNAALAERIGVSEMWVSRKIRALQEIGLDDLERITDALGVSADDLLARARGGHVVYAGRGAGQGNSQTTVPYSAQPERPMSGRHPIGWSRSQTPARQSTGRRNQRPVAGRGQRRTQRIARPVAR